MASEKHLIKAFFLGPEMLPLQPAIANREWMQNTARNFANRCLPLRIANQFGWFLINTEEIEVVWDGGTEQRSLKIHRPNGRNHGIAASHFGYGILTWQVPYLFRTPPGYNLYVRGPTNFPKDGAFALDGIVETDWAVATFTMNWKITCAGVPVRFGAGEPIALITPVSRGELGNWEIIVESIERDPALLHEHDKWSKSRATFNEALMEKPSRQAPWQKHYFFGRNVDGVEFDDHQTTLRLKPVVDTTGRMKSWFEASGIAVNCPDKEPAFRDQRVRTSFFRRLVHRIRGR